MNAAVYYEIRLAECLPDDWTSWFDGMDVQALLDGTSQLCGWLPDQAALHGVLLKIRNLGLTLISIQSYERRNINGI